MKKDKTDIVNKSSNNINLEKSYINDKDVLLIRKKIIFKLKTFLEENGGIWMSNIKQSNDCTILLLNVPSKSFENIYGIIKIYINEIIQIPKELYDDKLKIVIHFEERIIINKNVENILDKNNCNKIINKSKSSILNDYSNFCLPKKSKSLQ